MDAYLWKLRNICKNFANFGLLGILLWNIIQFITKKTGSIQSIITKSVVAGVLIQASWFIVAALLDISTIATAALSSFPSNFIDSNAFSKETITKNIEESIQNHILKLDKEGGVSIEEDKDAPRLTTEELIEKIMPKDYSVSGPLVYI